MKKSLIFRILLSVPQCTTVGGRGGAAAPPFFSKAIDEIIKLEPRMSELDAAYTWHSGFEGVDSCKRKPYQKLHKGASINDVDPFWPFFDPPGTPNRAKSTF